MDHGDGTLTLLEDDGNRYDFTQSRGFYEGQAGVHELIRHDAGAGRWELTRPSQWQRIYDDAGRLIEVRDSAGHALTVERDVANGGRIIALVSAAEKEGLVPSERLSFDYDPNTGLLVSVYDSGGNVWLFDYDGDQRLATVTFPPDPNDPNTPAVLTLAYDADGRITNITDGSGQTWTYQYDADTGMLTAVTDPPDGSGNAVVQTLGYSALMIDNRWETYYTDRSGTSWTYKFSRKGRLRERTEDGSSATEGWTYDFDANVTSYTTADGVTVHFVWGPDATLVSFDSPYTGLEGWQDWNTVSVQWEQADPTERPNFWRATLMTDLSGASVQFLYEDPANPARVTTMVDQGTGPDPVFHDGSLNVFPATGLDIVRRPYWLHPTAPRSGPGPRPHEQAYLDFQPETNPETGVGPYDWRFRWALVFPPFGHIGINYNSGSTRHVHYVDYGQPPCIGHYSACKRQCHPFCSGHDFHSNRRYWLHWYVRGLFGVNCLSFWHDGWPEVAEGFDALPCNFGPCCDYRLFGIAPHSNSNGGAHSGLHRVLGANHPDPPLGWVLLAPGWCRDSLAANDQQNCPGYTGSCRDEQHAPCSLY